MPANTLHTMVLERPRKKSQKNTKKSSEDPLLSFGRTTSQFSLEISAMDFVDFPRRSLAPDCGELPAANTSFQLPSVEDPAAYASSRFNVYQGDQEGELKIKFAKGTTVCFNTLMQEHDRRLGNRVNLREPFACRLWLSNFAAA